MLMWLCIFLLVLGTAFLLIELFLPGTEIFAVGGIISLIVSAVLAAAFVRPLGWFVVAGAVLIIAAFIWAMWRFAKQKQLKGNLILSDTDKPPEFPDLSEFLGKEGKALTLLRPSGEVEVAGKRLQAAAFGGTMLAEGTAVRVVEVMSDRVLVKALSEN